jgi:hypothetical protein
LSGDFRPPTPREQRESLPRGFVLDSDGKTVRRDARLLFREGWMLLLCLVCFAASAAGLFWWSFPRGGAGWIRLAAAIAVLLVAGGIAAPALTRALTRRNTVPGQFLRTPPDDSALPESTRGVRKN